ncbi:PAS domain-containing sensor histidine kinase (plasmid) [Hymenobacter tibetensis]|uniref:histidine kinase n=1 Tax=Hymenobacter tibetensis TaxID=497967 RepID=A0ABY4D7V4_9BACT|nr:PAS domain-containing sensor histidine kinase [Hymenobacter tibetensis]UOG77640.1 PAS domain-containing sensor histidine kinase [Hymenobacter tibetensis]UOG77681.1 PAS domain-containing sensor histidine kinase [Hymenobacter tibetensis]
MKSADGYHALETELRAVRAKLERLEADRIDKAEHQALTDRYQESQVRFRTIFENAPFGQKIIASDLVIRQANQAVLDMLGCASPEEVVGHQIKEFAHPDYRDDWHFLQQRLWAHKLPHFTLETCLVRTDGSSFWCQVTSMRFPDNGEELGFTQLEDISDRKALELSLKRLYDAQETILHLITHDVKTPIAHIQLLTDLLQRQVEAATFATDDATDTAKYLALIRRSCADANKLLGDVLLLGSLDTTQVKKQPTNLGALLENRLAAHQLTAHDKGLALVLDVPSQPLQANLHADTFQRVVDNLVSNALKFTPAGGRVTVGLQECPGCVLLTVRDTGIGIPEALQASLFEKFSPASRSGVGGEASTGLGLFITRQIVQLHRGKLWVESQEGAGSCFFVELH